MFYIKGQKYFKRMKSGWNTGYGGLSGVIIVLLLNFFVYYYHCYFDADSSMIARVLFLVMMVSCSGTWGDDWYNEFFSILHSEDVRMKLLIALGSNFLYLFD